tara:strand:+ start:3132 stop:7007 length:3876 start_codon:yes stop_codon:yes gene_type:complete
MKGLDYNLKPFISKVMLETGTTGNAPETPGYVDLYTVPTDTGAAEKALEKIKLTFSLSLKGKYPTGLGGDPAAAAATNQARLEQIAGAINSNVIRWKKITIKKTFQDFLLATNKGDFLKKLTTPFYEEWSAAQIWGNNPHHDITKYVYYEGNTPIINVPLSYTFKHNHAAGIPPTFLAYVFMYESSEKGATWTDNFAAEIIYDNSKVVTNSAYFTIGDTYSLGGQGPFPFTQTTLTTKLKEKSNSPGQQGFIESAVPTSDSETMALEFGLPGQVWCGAVHRRDDVTVNEYKYMGGKKHNPMIPHPYLVLNFKENSKIVDMRSATTVKNMFAYNSSEFMTLLAPPKRGFHLSANSSPLVSQKMANNPTVVSEVDYSIQRIKTDPGAPEASRVSLFFAIDKLNLLREYSTLSSLFERYGRLNEKNISYFVDKIKIIRFDISRIDLRTGEKSLLLSAPNDLAYSDTGKSGWASKYGKPLSKGFTFRRVTELTAKVDNSGYIDYYEFRDAELNPLTYDFGEYTYSVSLAFEDPFVAFLNNHLINIRTIIRDLDELLYKSTTKIIDPKPITEPVHSGMGYSDPSETSYAYKRSVDVYNRYYDKFNPIFIEKAKSDPAYLSFDLSDERPASVQSAFALQATKLASYLPNLFLALNNEFDRAQQDEGEIGHLSLQIASLVAFVRSATKLSTTNPTLLNQARTLLALLEDKVAKLVSLYQPRYNVRHDYTQSQDNYRSWIKNQGNLRWKATAMADPKIVFFEKQFKESLNLEKAKNHFDWVGHLPSLTGDFGGQESRIKSISNIDYRNTVVQNLGLTLGPDMPFDFADSAGMSFLPYTADKSMKIFNFDDKFIPVPMFLGQKPDNTFPLTFSEKAFQTMRKRVTGEYGSHPHNISVPDVLSYYGIRFKLGTQETVEAALQNNADVAQNIKDMLWDASETGYTDQLGGNAPYVDSFGSPFQQTKKEGGAAPANDESKKDPTAFKTINPYGSIADPAYNYQGASKEQYPLYCAQSLVNIIFSDYLKFPLGTGRALSLFDVNKNDFFFKDNFWTVKSLQTPMLPFGEALAALLQKKTGNPMALNTLAILGTPEATSLSFETLSQKPLHEAWINSIFNADGSIKWENYHTYILLFYLFGRVYYFDGFENSAAAPQGAISPMMANKKQIKAKVWKPLTKGRLMNIPGGQKLYCKVELYKEGLIDQRYADLFSQCDTYNKYFYIMSAPAPTSQSQKPPPSPPLNVTPPAPMNLGSGPPSITTALEIGDLEGKGGNKSPTSKGAGWGEPGGPETKARADKPDRYGR